MKRRCACSGVGIKPGKANIAFAVLYPYDLSFVRLLCRDRCHTEKPLLITSSRLMKANKLMGSQTLVKYTGNVGDLFERLFI